MRAETKARACIHVRLAQRLPQKRLFVQLLRAQIWMLLVANLRGGCMILSGADKVRAKPKIILTSGKSISVEPGKYCEGKYFARV